MKHNEFINKMTNELQKQLVTANNQLMGASKTAFLSIGLFIKLPIRVEAFQYEKSIQVEKLGFDDLFNNLVVRTDFTKTPEIVFTFLYKEEKYLKRMLKLVKKHYVLASYYYIKEVQHIIRKHYTAEYQTMMIRAIPTQKDPHIIIKLTCDMTINKFMEKLFKQSAFKKEWEKIKTVVPMPRKNLHIDIDILKDLASNTPQPTAYFNNKRFVTLKINGFTYHTPTSIDAHKTREINVVVANMSTTLLDVIRSNGKGVHGADTILESFEAVKVNTYWLDDFKIEFNSVTHRKTTKFAKTWKRLSNTYRNIFNAPSNEYYDNKVNIIISIDQSGSMHIEDMAKVYGIVQQNKHRINELTVLIHDVDLVYTNNTKNIENVSKNDIKNMVGTRYVKGGTSHAKVFKFITDMKIKNPEKYIYICMSDMYSDIETEFPKYKKTLKHIATFWLAPSNCREIDTTIFGGKNIQLP